jgi:organic hydroperoxide reductase OsmC/OhrA
LHSIAECELANFKLTFRNSHSAFSSVDWGMPTHTYRLTNRWTGNLGSGTSGYKAYGRDHEISIAGKSDLLASSDPHYRGDPSRYSPEELLLAAISGCHMLWYLHFCSDSQIIVVNYQDEAEATMEVAADGNGRFTTAVLRPHVTITSAEKVQLSEHLHEKAHKFCFIANSVNFPITVEPRTVVTHG